PPSWWWWSTCWWTCCSSGSTPASRRAESMGPNVIANDSVVVADPRGARRLPGATALRSLARDPLALLGLAILVGAAFVAAFADLIAPGDPLDMAGIPLQWPGDDPAHVLGTDSLGRDVFSGLVHGTRASLMIGLSAAGVSLALGCSSGRSRATSGAAPTAPCCA